MPETGTLIDGKYRILSKLREGGMGAIYKVHHALLDEVRVIKVMRAQSADNPDLQRRFAQEAQLITRVRHRNICLIFDFAIDEDLTAYIVMEFIEGVSLADWLKLSGPLEVPLALEIAHQCLEALEYLHRKRVIHRDISPENIMLTTDHDGRLLVKLIDLGIAKALDAEGGVTQTGVFVGKFKYSSPEQLMSDGEPLDGRTDLYSLAVVLYQMLTGHLPVRGTTAHQLAAAHLFQPPVPFDETDSGQRIPEDVRSTILRSLEKKRNDRFADSTELRRTIETIQSRLPKPDMFEAAAFMELVLSTSRSAVPDHPTPTPSAQERLNLRFQPSDTPLPTAETVDAFSESGDAPTTIDANVSESGSADPTVIRPLPKPRRGVIIWGIALLAAAILGTVIVTQPSDTRELERRIDNPTTTARSTIPTADTATVATLVVTPDTIVENSTSTTTVPVQIDPPVTETVAGTRRPAIVAPDTTGRARAGMLASRRGAETAGARDLASTSFAGAEQVERQAESLYRSGRMDAARARFIAATELYQQAATAAEVERARRLAQQNAEARARAAEAERRRLEQEARERQAALEKRKTVDPPPTQRSEVSEEPRVRSVIQRYVNAAESLDVDAYLAVYPSADRRRIESGFSSLRAQSLTLDIRSVEIAGDGQSATVKATETRVATPRAGTEQRVGGDRTITLARRGSNWVITSIR